jgi:hypothetical protein
MSDQNEKTILEFISWNLKVLAQSHERLAKAMEEHNEILREQNNLKKPSSSKSKAMQQKSLREMLNSKPYK